MDSSLRLPRLVFSIFALSVLASCSIGSGMAGGLKDSEGIRNSVEIEELARFAVDEHNKKENALLEFASVVKAREQVVAGTLHHLTVEAVEAGKNKIYEARIWVKPWLNFKELQEFRHVGDADSGPQDN